MVKEVKELVEELLTLVGIKASIEVNSEEGREGNSIHVVIDADDEAGLLIGAHGATLNAIQSFIGMAIRQQTGEWSRVDLDIGQWRQKHEEYLVGLANQAAERALSTGQAQHLYNLTPSQRRIIHMALSNSKGVVSESMGEGESRYLVVKPE